VPILLYLVLRHQRQPFRVLASIVQKFPIVNVSINVTLNVSVPSPSPITLFSNPPPLLDLLSPCSSNITRSCSLALLLCFVKERNLGAYWYPHRSLAHSHGLHHYSRPCPCNAVNMGVDSVGFIECLHHWLGSGIVADVMMA